MRTIVIKPEDLNRQQVGILSRLHLRENDDLAAHFNKIKNHLEGKGPKPGNYTIFIVYSKGKVIGWALVQQNKKVYLEVYVKRQCRKMGIGRHLVECAIRFCRLRHLPMPTVWAWDMNSYLFFNKFKELHVRTNRSPREMGVAA